VIDLSPKEFSVDIVDWNMASDEFRRVIEDERIKIYEPSL